MNRLYNDEERLKRAQIISEMRNNSRISVDSINKKQSRGKMSLLTKTFIQVVVSICIFGLFYFISQNYSFAIEKVKPIMSEDTDFLQMYNEIVKNFNGKNQDVQNEEVNEIEEKIVEENNEVSERVSNEIDDTISEVVGIGGR